jgi:3D-(3,5/4)-trihydroxycyclohexane-1,2-dione acylhydrolase (decyclizing)
MPGDLHKLWRTRDPKGYHVEYGYSCMGYEIAGGLGAKMADPDREVFVMVGDGSYLMMAQEIVTAVQEGVKLTIVVVQNHGFASIGALSESVGSSGSAPATATATRRAARSTATCCPSTSPRTPRASAPTSATRPRSRSSRRRCARRAPPPARPSCTCRRTPLVPAPSSEAWWDVPVAEVASVATTRAARAAYERDKRAQRIHLTTREEVKTQ